MLKNNDYYMKLFKEKDEYLVGLLDSKMRDEVSKITRYFFISLMPYMRTLQSQLLKNKEIKINNIKFTFISETEDNIKFIYEPGISEPLLFSLSKLNDEFRIYKYMEEKNEGLIKLEEDLNKINKSDEFETIFYSSDYHFYMENTKFHDLETTLKILEKNIYHNCVYTYLHTNSDNEDISYSNSENITDIDIIANLIDLKVLYELEPVKNYYKKDLSLSLFEKLELSDELGLNLDYETVKNIHVIDELLHEYKINDVHHFLLIEEYERLLNYVQINYLIDSYKEIVNYLVENNYTNEKNTFYDDHNTEMMAINKLPGNKCAFSLKKENSIYEPREICILISEDDNNNPIHIDIYYSYENRDESDSYGKNVDFNSELYNKKDVISNLYNDCLLFGNNVNRFTSGGLFELFKENKNCPYQRVLSYNLNLNKRLIFNSLMGQNCLSLLHNSICILDTINEYKDIKP